MELFMKKYFNLYVILGLSFFAIFLFLIILLQIDKAAIAPSGEPVGLSHLNNIVKYNENASADKMSDILFYLTFSALLAGAILGLYQLIKRKSLKEVDFELYVFVITMVICAIFWLLFDKALKINVRPINKDEGSFPSTHVFIGTFLVLFGHYLLTIYKDDKAVKYSSVVLAAVVIIALAGLRVVAGMHYITDVIGGIFLGLSFYFLSVGVIKIINNKKELQKTENKKEVKEEIIEENKIEQE